MSLHHSTFEYLQPTDNQLAEMADIRAHFADFAEYLDSMLHKGPDKAYVLRQLRDCAMWANCRITRTADGTPRI